MIVSEIDKLEQLYHEEFEKTYQKDRRENKDLNRQALEELKQQSYFFAYLRAQEQLYTQEQNKKRQKERERLKASEDPNADSVAKKERVLSSVRNSRLGVRDDLAFLAQQSGGPGPGDASEGGGAGRASRHAKFREEFRDVFELEAASKSQL
mmetsp:Transcript_11254/g.18947  ORF Transcript_11254/g.18947 Transcript_11254/m.18947 type:complete len:152 (-) Transcript_11254:35-490(-)